MTSKSKKVRRVLIWGVLAVALASMLLPSGAYLLHGIGQAQAAAEQGHNPRADFWRAVREGDPGYSSVKGSGSDVLISGEGQNWRALRNGPISTYGPWTLAAIAAALALMYFVFGPMRLHKTESSDYVLRWNGAERFVHWLVTVLFIILAITGLSLLFGRAVLMPLLGPEGFAAYASLAMVSHNYLGPLFFVSLLVMVLMYVKDNIPNGSDVKWLLRGGGMFGGGEPHADRTNGGEKLWFWIIAIVGLVGVGVSGLLLDFPNFGQARDTLQQASLIHGALAILWVAISLGHIYLATIGSPGALRGMTRGYVSKEWMQQHHDLWYEKKKGEREFWVDPDHPREPGGQRQPT